MKKALLLLSVFVCPAALRAEADKPLLLQNPTLSRIHVVFVCADDLWIVGRAGGEAKRLTNGVGLETDPIFSPDGKWIAFTGEYEGNPDGYVIPAGGGVPRRLTYHPGADRAVGWSPDGKQVLFQSARASSSRYAQLFTVPVEGGFPIVLPLPEADHGCYSPDGTHLAYVPIRPAFRIWKRYRGGTTTPIWIARLSDSSITRIPVTRPRRPAYPNYHNAKEAPPPRKER